MRQTVCGRLCSCPFNLDHLSFFQNTQMPAQIAIRKRAQLFEIVERQSFRICNQRGKDAEASAFVDHPIQPFVGKAAFVAMKA